MTASTGTAGVTGVHHLGITCRNLDEAVAFYCEGLGFELERRFVRTDVVNAQVVGVDVGTIANAFVLAPGGTRIELLQYEQGSATASTDSPAAVAAAHLCLSVVDLPAAIERLVGFGAAVQSRQTVRVTRADGTSVRLVYLRDPSGFVIELSEVESGP